jgi:hypothetical protein
MTITELTEKLSNACDVQINGSMQFSTDSRFPKLPSDINHWIEFLYRAGLELPEHVVITQKGDALTSTKGSAMYELHHMDELLRRFPAKKKFIFEE